MKKKLRTAKRFVDNHSTGICVIGTAITATIIHIRVINDINERLEARGIDPIEFHNDGETF